MGCCAYEADCEVEHNAGELVVSHDWWGRKGTCYHPDDSGD